MSHYPPDKLSESAGLALLAQAKRSARASNGATAVAGCPEAGDLTSAVAGCAVSAATASPRVEAHSRGRISPFQFRLRTMLVVVAALSGLFAVMQFAGAVWSAILVWFLFLVVAHVTANFWGTRVAPRAGRQHVVEPEHDGQIGIRPCAAAATGAVRLSESLRPGWPMFVATAVGAIVGGTLGSVALVLLSLDRAGYAGVIVGTISAAAVGGFLGFLTSSFVEIALRAWREAISGINDNNS